VASSVWLVSGGAKESGTKGYADVRHEMAIA